MKTASRIVGTAAFLAGYEVQDSPVYGAERRGAAVAAYTRIDDAPILERGTITRPDLIVVADETLLANAAAGVLAGQESAAAVFLNTADAGPLVAEFGIRAAVVSDDVTTRTQEILGRASALSAGLGAAAARLTGLIAEEQLLEAMREEFPQQHLSAEEIEKNLQIARAVFSALAPVEFSGGARGPEEAVASIGYSDPLQGSPSILEPGNAALRDTGSWRTERPVIDRSVCTRCGLCFVECPDGAIALDEHGYPVIDYDHCKGCMICRHVCPIEAIQSEKETRAW